MSRTVLVLGAGIGGIVAAETLRRLLPASDRVIAADRAGEHFFPSSLLWLMVGERTQQEFSRPLNRLYHHRIDFRNGNVTRIDSAQREVEIAGGRIVILTAAPQYKCPAAPYETALLVDDYLRKRGLREKTTIEFFAAAPRTGSGARGRLDQRKRLGSR